MGSTPGSARLLRSTNILPNGKKTDDEDELGVVSLETMIRAIGRPERFLDIVENFVAFEEEKKGLVKKLAKNHQFLGVNRTIEAVMKLKENRGRLGVFWHTQGTVRACPFYSSPARCSANCRAIGPFSLSRIGLSLTFR
jgi:hypothetical protein